MAHTELDVTLETVVHFSCPDGLTLTGPNVTICVNDSHWVPDPKDVKCVNTNGNHVTFKSVLFFFVVVVVLFLVSLFHR